MTIAVLLFCVFFALSVDSKPLDDEVTCGYESCPVVDPEALNVHLIPHSHDDVGWLKTLDQYYFQDVENVISSVVDALRQNPDRRFVQVETAYFKKWWERQNDAVKQKVIKLVNNGQLEIINGAWSMNDEAAVHYQSTIDQFTLGLRYLEDNLGKCARPRVSWQIDPFGHSREQASISAHLGFDSFFFARLDYRDKANRLNKKTMDLLWRGSANLGNTSDIFTSVLYRHYSAPPGFCFDIVCNDEPIIDDEESPDYNYKTRVADFANFVREQAPHYPTNNLLVTMGDDFRPASKHFERQGNNLLQVAKQLAVNGQQSYYNEQINSLKEAVGVMQHHDAITGTEKQHVAHNYHLLLSRAMKEANDAAATLLSNLISGGGENIEFDSCLLANVSACTQTETNDATHSGAYIFIPDLDETHKIASGPVKTTLFSGNVSQGVLQEFGSWAKQFIKVYNDDRSYIEFDWIIGPISIEEGGKEVITKFKTSLQSNGVFYTDSNGREMLKRTRNSRPDYEYTNEQPTSGNYYPVNTKIVIRDENQDLELAVLTDRSQGGSSIRDGEIELMVHRACHSDDGRGVGENLDEQEYGQGIEVRGKHFLVVGPSQPQNSQKSLAAIERDIAQRKTLAPWAFVTSQDVSTKLNILEFSSLKVPLPDNVQILTLEPWDDGTLLLRLEHLLEKGEDENLSKEVTVDLTDLFVKFTITELQETTLGGNILLQESTRLHWPGSEGEGGDSSITDLKSCLQADPQALNVHLIPHSHDDLGWLKTVDKYYFQDVQNVISSVIGALKQNPERRFVQVETAYFKRWWDQQSDRMKQDVVNLVNNGQFEIINGGWCMNDEADVNYQSTIDQYTLGLRFIKDTFGECGRPRVGWQIDTFGHSREQASISAQMGFDSLFFMRLDYRDKNKRLEEKTADLLWRGSQNLGNSSDIFTSLFYGAYSFPSSFCFDIVCNDEPIIDDEDSPDYNYERRVEEFAEYLRGQASKYPTNNILVVMGDDVRYQAAFTNYINIDRLIKGFNLFPQIYDDKPIRLLYSTPSCYAKAVNDYVTTNNYYLDIKNDDFLPYATDAYGYWTGFFTSRPSTKRFERLGNNFLQIAKQLAASTSQEYQSNITPLKEAMGVIQHHDAITGTEKQNVLKDYHRMLYAAMQEANDFLNPLISTLITGSPESGSLDFKTCLLANVSFCPPSKSDKFTMAIYNPLSRVVSAPISLPVDVTDWIILDPTGEEVTYQVDPTIIDFSYVTDGPTSPYSLEFVAKDLPPLGFKIYTFERGAAPSKLNPIFGYDNTNFAIDDATGLLKSVTMNGVTMEVSQDLAFYKSGDYSGAYIFVPIVNDKFRVAQDKVKTTPISGNVYQGVLQEFASWAKQTIKVYHDDRSYIEIDWIIGPVDISDGVGKEVVSVFTTPLATNGDFYTDSNGREMLKRTRNYRPTFEYTNEEPISGNYHPITSRIVLKDEQKGLELAILNDRAQGGTSLEDGQVEIMIQRICPHHDFSITQRNVGDNIDDQEYGQAVVIRGKHYLILGPSSGNEEKTLAAIQRDVAQRKLLAPWKFITNQDVSNSLKNLQFSSLKRPLSDNIQILTLEPWEEGTLLLRLEHVFEKDEDENLSKDVTVDLSDLFTQFTINDLQETALGGNVLLEDVARLHWPGSDTVEDSQPPRDINDLTITLAPMQIRTFLAKSCPIVDPGALNVHIVPHSHDDVGWLKTFDQYYFQDVQNVLSSVIVALKLNPDRRFVQVETAFFKKWWEQQKDSVKADVTKLVNNGQLEIINGAWSMNDEAGVHYQFTIDQYTIGLRYLEDELGKCSRPRVAWQIDPFGHSREQASISAHLGFDSIFFARLDYRDKANRLEKKTGDLIWRGSSNLGNTSDIFTSVLYNHYSAPPSFCFDIVCNDEPIIDDEESPDYNYQKRVEEFADFVRGQGSKYPSNNVMVPMGDDFRYQAALNSYINTDRLIKGFDLFNETFEGKPIKVFYSTPSCYAKAVNDYVLANDYRLEIKTDDFFPYSDGVGSMVVGYFTSRPASKRFIREGNNLLQVAKQLAAVTKIPYDDNNINSLKEAMGVMQHHDAITGTELIEVTHDYHRLFYDAINNANEAIDSILSNLINGGSGESFLFKTCLLSNVSSCPQTKADQFTVAIYNPLSRVVSSPINLPVDTQNWKILDPDGNEIIYQVEPTITDFSQLIDEPASPYTLEFVATDLPPLGFKIYTFAKTIARPEKLRIGNNETSFETDTETGLLKSVTMNGVTMEITQDLLYYTSGGGSAYIFTPDGVDAKKIANISVKTSIIEGDIYVGILQEFSDWAKQIIKVYNDDRDYIEFDWLIGPMNINDGGKEVISRFTTPLKTEGTFYTDSNGREMLKRVRNFRPDYNYTNEQPISGNYYPVTSKIVIKDEEQGLELAILNDRAQGGSSIEDGQVELMIHRAIRHNDQFGLDEQEYGHGIVVRGKHYLVLGPSSGNGKRSTAAIQRDVAQRKFLPPWIFVTDQDLREMTLAANVPLEESDRLHWPGSDGEMSKKVQNVQNFTVTLAPMQIRTFLANITYNN
ncbi:lysosomal alpha-mannosidase [Asbolus verrucosus]|uniref:alpha-mannosidase n=1 Tax=Asbolus verrucosus TaxID=1661398 RepID=A0A482VIS6_ASBVE|nr:lysosomal alpha-mannosidase [Asbolus verrucosus]